MKRYLTLSILILLFSLSASAQVTYTRAEVIKLSNYIHELEKKDSIAKIESNLVSSIENPSSSKVQTKNNDLVASSDRSPQMVSSNNIGYQNCEMSEKKYTLLKNDYEELSKKYNQLKSELDRNINYFRTSGKSKKAKYSTVTFFEYNSAYITSEYAKLLDEAIQKFNKKNNLKIEINGFTDNSGSSEFNMALSKERAEAVKDYLVLKGVPASKIFTKGWGDVNPLYSNETEDGRAKNRRVEVDVLD